MSFKGMVISDFDGTLYDKAGGFHGQDIEMLNNLKKWGYLRVLATGRSLESLYRAINSDFPVDYVVFSSGAGVYDLKKKQLLKRTVFSTEQTIRLSERLIELKIDFMVHHPIPDNHYFHYYKSEGSRDNESKDRDSRDGESGRLSSRGEGSRGDFLRRIELYRDYALPFEWRQVRWLEATQFVLITPADEGLLKRVKSEFETQYSVIWSSSPLDGSSLWIELFPLGAHKGSGIAWLAESLGINRKDTMAVGNDFNDMHMLEWSGAGFVVANAPEGLRGRFSEVAPCGDGGFAQAVNKWFDSREKTN